MRNLRELSPLKAASAFWVGAAALALAACAEEAATSNTTAPAAEAETAEMSSAPVAQTEYGAVEGLVEDDVLVFKGVRYGADTQTTRFEAPAEPASWKGVQDAKNYGNTCLQTLTGNPGGLFTSWAPDPEPPLSEDCLFLNVWTPSLEGNDRPVMVWLHGGGFSTGSGTSNVYDGARLAARGDVVVVTINHRLNVLGYLALGHYGEGFENSASAGVLDMVLALEWVRDNIENFGGDPDNVMIFGESGGGSKVSTLMAIDEADGLFHRAVIQSGALLRFLDQDFAQAESDKVVEKLGLTAETIDEIKTMPIEEIRAAARGTRAALAPSIDGNVLTDHPFVPEAAAPGADVPLMLGWNRTENTLFAAIFNQAAFELTEEQLIPALQRAMPDRDAEAVVALYREADPELGPVELFFEATTDERYLSSHTAAAEAKFAQAAAPTYLYLFNWETPVQGGKYLVPHALEIGFVFDNVAKSESMSGIGEEQQAVADIMADTWIAFARNGDPNNEHLPTWPAYDMDSRAIMVLDESPEMIEDARGAQREFFDMDWEVSRYQQR